MNNEEEGKILDELILEIEYIKEIEKSGELIFKPLEFLAQAYLGIKSFMFKCSKAQLLKLYKKNMEYLLSLGELILESKNIKLPSALALEALLKKDFEEQKVKSKIRFLEDSIAIKYPNKKTLKIYQKEREEPSTLALTYGKLYRILEEYAYTIYIFEVIMIKIKKNSSKKNPHLLTLHFLLASAEIYLRLNNIETPAISFFEEFIKKERILIKNILKMNQTENNKKRKWFM